MAEITALFFDVGGVLLSDGWDHPIRQRAAEHFQLDAQEFEVRHEQAVASFEKGRLSLDEYLDRTIFYRSQLFTRQAFRDWMFSQSTARPETLGVAERLARSEQYLMATLNNESLELNEYRIGHFGLRNYFAVFLSSCYLGVAKPEDAIYRLALQLTQRHPEECVFIDDRPANLEAARRCRIRSVQFRGAPELEQALREMGVAF